MAKKFSLEDFAVVKAESAALPRSILLYGPPKRGKTTCAASIVDVPGYERTLVVDVEGGAAAISQWHPTVDVVGIRTAEEFDFVIESLVNGKFVEKSSGLPYQCVIIDTLDKAQERKLEWFDVQPDAFNAQGQKNSLYKWGAIKAWTTKLADALHMAPFLTIFLAHVIDHENEKTGRTTQTVALGGSTKYSFSATPDIVGYFDVVRVTEDGKKVQKREIDFTLVDRRITGQRYADKLNGKIQDPNMSQIYKILDPSIFDVSKNVSK